MSITENKKRIGNFTSGQIYRLLGSNRVKETYIEEKELERLLGVSIKEDAGSRASNWGTIMEHFVNEHYLPKDWQPWTKGTILSYKISYWSGTPDIASENGIGDIKCFYRKKFGQIAKVIKANDLERFKKDFPDIYWQITSNAALANKTKCMVLAYLPFKSELDAIAKWVENYEIDEPWKYRFITECYPAELPHQSNESAFENVMIMEWDLLQEDVEKLERELKLLDHLFIKD